MPAWLSILVAYAVGCVSFALLVARAHGVDIRGVGSGNPGATNVGRALGKGWGAFVLVLDIAKGFVPAWWLRAPVDELAPGMSPWIVDAEGRVLVAAAAILGHVWPVTHRFRGGKGVATYLGALLALDPVLALVGALVHRLVKKGMGFVSLASVCLVWSVPAAQVAMARIVPDWLRLPDGTLVLVLLAAVITVRHRENFRRLRSGTESRYDGGSPTGSEQNHERS